MERICEFQNYIDCNELKEQYKIQQYELVNLSIGYDELVYLLYSRCIPERVNGMFVPTKSNSDYKCITLVMDWINNELLGSKMYDLGIQKVNLHFIQPIGNDFLLLGARAHLYKDGTTDQNAMITDRYGRTIKKFCLGDGIQDCIVTMDKKIITSYFDEGIFGNYGWDNPLGQNGIVIWDELGEKIWENTKYDICDCYAINIDDQNNLWFYYYSDFHLVKTNFHKDQVYDINIEGSSAFLINKKQNELIFDGGYHNHHFIGYRLDKDIITDKFIFDLTYSSSRLLLKRYTFRSSKAVFMDNNSRIFCKEFI